MKALGAILVVLGILALVYQGFSYTKREKVLDVGPIEASADTQKRVGIPPLVGGAVLVAGVALLVIGNRRTA